MGLEMTSGSPTSERVSRVNDQSRRQPKICIVGAGMGGLTCALALAQQGFTDINVYEMASNLGFVGAGIQLAPNMAKVLDRLGVWDEIDREATKLSETSIVDGQTDAELAHVQLDYIKEQYGYPHMVGHRASLAGSLYDGCLKQKSVKFNFGHIISNVHDFHAKPKFTATPKAGGQAFDVEADVLLACDGVKSASREKMLEELNIDAKVVDTNQAAYRIMLKREDMEKDPELLELINGDKVTRWIAERRHIIAYPVSNKQVYNLSTVQPDTNFAAAPSATYTTKGSKPAMLKVFEDFCPKVHKMLNLVPEGEVCEWKLRVHEPLPTWIHGSMALVGDACHPTLPHLGQGAAQAIEDAAVIGTVLGKLTEFTPETINKALKVYEKVRKERAETLVGLAAASGRALHLGDGAAKEERDKAFAQLRSGEGKVPDKWADAEVQKVVYGADCVAIADEQFDVLYAAV